MTPDIQGSFQELSPRERLAALLDLGHFRELAGPFDRIGSPWLQQQGLVPQSDDGVIAVRGSVDGHAVVAIAIEGGFEGGSIGEVGGAKIATALELAAESSRLGQPVAALLLLETGGVRLQEATLGLAAIAAIHTAILNLSAYVPVIAVIAGPVGCFGGMSLAAQLCTHIIGTPYGRLGMNGPEVIEQEAGADEIDASDRELIWQLVGCEARFRDGWIDTFVPDDLSALAAAIHSAVAQGRTSSSRLAAPATQLQRLREEIPARPQASVHEPVSARSCLWLQALAESSPAPAFATPSILTARVALEDTTALAISIVPDPESRLPRASHGELGLEQAWALAACLDQFVLDEQQAGTRSPIIAIVDTPGQAFGRIEEQRCISAAAAAAVGAYARARAAGHPVFTLVTGRAVSGSFLAHGLQSDYILAIADEGVSMYAMSAQSIARITRRDLATVQALAAATLPMSFAIADAHRLGVIDDLIEGINADRPTAEDIARVKSCFGDALAAWRRGQSTRSSIPFNPQRQSTQRVRDAMRAQWSSAADAGTKERSASSVSQPTEGVIV